MAAWASAAVGSSGGVRYRNCLNASLFFGAGTGELA
jgi:hypothetical protein